jgi:effector-binding domain-containing protein
MLTEPKLEERPAQPYVGIRTETPMAELGEVIPRLHDEVLSWLEARGLSPAGPPFIRYHVIDMANALAVTLGWPVAESVAGDARVEAGELPAGRYASLVYTGIENGIEGNRALLEWGAEQGLAWDTFVSERGDGFGARFETFLTEPDDEPDPTKWETEVAIRLADEVKGAS